jgi:hypothetical protein
MPTHLRHEPRGHPDPLRHPLEDRRDAPGIESPTNLLPAHEPPKNRPFRGRLDFGAKSAGILFLKTWAKMPGTSITF